MQLNGSSLIEFIRLQSPGRSFNLPDFLTLEWCLLLWYSVCVFPFQIFYDLVRQINRKTPVEKKKPKKKSCLLL